MSSTFGSECSASHAGSGNGREAPIVLNRSRCRKPDNPARRRRPRVAWPATSAVPRGHPRRGRRALLKLSLCPSRPLCAARFSDPPPRPLRGPPTSDPLRSVTSRQRRKACQQARARAPSSATHNVRRALGWGNRDGGRRAGTSVNRSRGAKGHNLPRPATQAVVPAFSGSYVGTRRGGVVRPAMMRLCRRP